MKDLMLKRFSLGLILVGVLAVPTGIAQAQAAETHATQAGQFSTPEAQSPEKKKEVEDENEAYLHSPSVKALGGKLGLNPEQAATVFQVANFLVLAVIIGWFLLKTLPKKFLTRSAGIQKELVDARIATEAASTRLNSVESRLDKLDEQIAGMRAQAENDSVLDEQRIKATVEEETQKILAAADAEITAATTAARRQIQQFAAELAIEQAAQQLVVSAETDRLLVQNFARRLTGDDSKEGHN